MNQYSGNDDIRKRLCFSRCLYIMCLCVFQMLLVAALFFGSVGGLVVAAILKRWVCQTSPALTPRGRIQREIWGMKPYMLICWNWLESHLVSESTAKSAFHCLLSLTTRGKGLDGVGICCWLDTYESVHNIYMYLQEVSMWLGINQ